MKPRFFPLVLLPFLMLAGEANSQDTSSAQEPETGFTLWEKDRELTISFDGEVCARYDLRFSNKPFLWAIIGPTGKVMTRAPWTKHMDLKGENRRDHPHHRGLLFGHESIGRNDWHLPKTDEDWKRMAGFVREPIGGDTWHDSSTFFNSFGASNEQVLRGELLAKIKHRVFKTLDANDDRAVVVQVCDYLDRDGRKFLEEKRTLTFRVFEKTRTIDVDQILIASDGDVVLHDSKDAGLAIRVPSSMAIDSKLGGSVINSEGDVDGDAWSKPARWCDYHGPVEGEHLGIAILNHPSSYRFPTRWHVRKYGLFAANPFGSKAFGDKFEDATTKLKQGESLTLRHRFIFHLGSAEDAKIEEAWQQYSKENTADGGK